MIVGIDLGTTNSLVGYMTPDGPKLIPNAFGELLTPSVVGVDLDNNWLVGKSARELQTVHPERCAAVFKRHMGSDWKITIGGKTLTAVELSSMVLKALKDDAESALGVPIQEAVITVPAYFNEPQRQATIQAGRLAGLEVRRVINEPTAAAIAYGLHEKSNEGILLVYDLGGGTFDVSIVEVFEGVLEVRSSAGEIFLGGEDFTTSLAAKILEGRGLMFERAEHEQPRMVARLKRECELAKRALATAPSATVRIPDRDGSLREGGETATVTADEFRTWTANLLGRTTPPLRRALRDAKLTTNNIDEVILVGGATRMATVREHITSLFGKPPQSRLNPDEVVALGAAIQSALLKGDAAVGDMVVTDVCPFTLGVETSREIGGVRKGGYFSPIINRNTTIPASRTETYSTLVPGQTEINFAIYQGESRYVADNLRLGELKVTGIPLSPKTESVDVRFTYDINGVLEVEATVQATGKKSSHVISRYASHLSPAQLDAAIKKLQALKTHPREQAENQHLLQLAGRVWQELSVFERDQLDGAISVFEAALEDQSPTKIAEAREFLLAYLAPFLDELEPGDDGDE